MKRASLCLLGIAALSLAGSLRAQTGAPGATAKGSASYVAGTVISSTDTQLAIRTEAGEEMVLHVDSSSILPSSLTVGSLIDVKYRALSGGSYHAAEVRMLGTADPATDSASTEGEGRHGTASPLPIIALIGLLALGAASGVWLAARRMA